MLEVGVHDGENASLGNLPAADYGGRESPLALSANHVQLRKFVGQAERDFPGAVRTVIVNNNDFVLKIRNGIEDGNELCDDRGDVFAFIVSRKDQ